MASAGSMRTSTARVIQPARIRSPMITPSSPASPRAGRHLHRLGPRPPCPKRAFAIHADRLRPRLRAGDLVEAMMVGADQAEFIPHALQEPLGVALLALHAWRAIEVAGRDHR